MSNMVHDKYVQQRGICTCTHIASKCHKYFTDSIKKFAVSNTNGFISVFPTRTLDLNMLTGVKFYFILHLFKLFD